MADANDLFHTPYAARYVDELQNAQQLEAERIAQLREYREECTSVMEVLETLPNRLEHRIMVPFSKHAFFPGYLYHTNELMVEIGSGYRIQCTVPQASQVLQRRCTFLDSSIAQAERQVDSLTSRLESTKPDHEGEPAEIRHSLEESDELLASATTSQQPQTPSISRDADGTDRSFAHLMGQLQELARLEEASEFTDVEHQKLMPSTPVSDAAMRNHAHSSVDTAGAGDVAADVEAVASQFQQVDLDDIFEDATPLAHSAAKEEPQCPQDASSVSCKPSSTTKKHHWQQDQTAGKSALKKGFLLAPKAEQSTPPKLHPTTTRTPDTTSNGHSSGGAGQLKGASKAALETFTGHVLERMPGPQVNHSPPSTSEPCGQRLSFSSGQATSAAYSPASIVVRSDRAGDTRQVSSQIREESGSSMQPGTSTGYGGTVTGAPNVVERGTANAQGSVVAGQSKHKWEGEETAAVSAQPGVPGQAAPPKKMSKFKQRALGLGE